MRPIAGASDLVVVDLSLDKLQLAKQWGATKIVLSHEIEQQLSTEHYPHGFGMVVDVTGIPPVIEQAFRYLGSKGNICSSA